MKAESKAAKMRASVKLSPEDEQLRRLVSAAPRGRRYPRISTDLHAVVMARADLWYPGCHVDHINGDPMDNRRENLRCVNRSVNSANRVNIRRNKMDQTLPVGVQRTVGSLRNPFEGRVAIDGKPIRKRFKTAEEAGRWTQMMRNASVADKLDFR